MSVRNSEKGFADFRASRREWGLDGRDVVAANSKDGGLSKGAGEGTAAV